MERFKGIAKDIEKDVRELFVEHRLILFMVIIVMLGVMAIGNAATYNFSACGSQSGLLTGDIINLTSNIAANTTSDCINLTKPATTTSFTLTIYCNNYWINNSQSGNDAILLTTSTSGSTQTPTYSITYYNCSVGANFTNALEFILSNTGSSTASTIYPTISGGNLTASNAIFKFSQSGVAASNANTKINPDMDNVAAYNADYLIHITNITNTTTYQTWTNTTRYHIPNNFTTATSGTFSPANYSSNTSTPVFSAFIYSNVLMSVSSNASIYYCTAETSPTFNICTRFINGSATETVNGTLGGSVGVGFTAPIFNSNETSTRTFGTTTYLINGKLYYCMGGTYCNPLIFSNYSGSPFYVHSPGSITTVKIQGLYDKAWIDWKVGYTYYRVWSSENNNDTTAYLLGDGTFRFTNNINGTNTSAEGTLACPTSTLCIIDIGSLNGTGAGSFGLTRTYGTCTWDTTTNPPYTDVSCYAESMTSTTLTFTTTIHYDINDSTENITTTSLGKSANYSTNCSLTADCQVINAYVFVNGNMVYQNTPSFIALDPTFGFVLFLFAIGAMLAFPKIEVMLVASYVILLALWFMGVFTADPGFMVSIGIMDAIIFYLITRKG